jgi:hypothetical protein
MRAAGMYLAIKRFIRSQAVGGTLLGWGDAARLGRIKFKVHHQS